MGLQLSRRSPVLFNMNACILILALAVAAQAQKFEPAKCDAGKEMVCPGQWDPKTGEQTTPDTCMPMKNGDCMNHCPLDGGKEMMCPGKWNEDWTEQLTADTCMPMKNGDC